MCVIMSRRVFVILIVTLVVILFITDPRNQLAVIKTSVLPEKRKGYFTTKTSGYKVASFEVMTRYKYFQMMHFPVQEIEFVRELKNPCFFVEKSPNSCKGRMHTSVCLETQLKCLPYFLVLGIAKGGTTDLEVKLRRHHQVQSLTLSQGRCQG